MQTSATCSISLRHVHVQRLRAAVAAAREGGDIRFRANATEPPTVVWVDARHPRVQHVVLNAYGQVGQWKAAAEAEFHRLLLEELACAARA